MTFPAMVIHGGHPGPGAVRGPCLRCQWNAHADSGSRLCQELAGWQLPGLDLALIRSESVPAEAPAAIRQVTSCPQSGVVGCPGDISPVPGAGPALAMHPASSLGPGGGTAQQRPLHPWPTPTSATHQDGRNHQRLVGQRPVRVPHPDLRQRGRRQHGLCPTRRCLSPRALLYPHPPTPSRPPAITLGKLTSRWPCRDFSKMRSV